VTRIVVSGNPMLRPVRTDRPDLVRPPEGKSQSACSTRFAAALVTGKAGLDQFTEPRAHPKVSYGA